jgi:hypothetical protein
MTEREELYSKLSAEYEAFIENLKSLPPQEIIEAAYEKVFKEEILSCLEYGVNLSNREISALLTLDNPLDGLYRNWLHTDVSYTDDLTDSIHGFAVRETEWQTDVGRKILEPGESPETEKSDSPAVPEPRLPTARAVNGEINAGDWVIVGHYEEYAGLVGRVSEIIKLGSPEHDTGNPTDDIVVDLSLLEYSDFEKGEILAKAKNSRLRSGFI